MGFNPINPARIDEEQGFDPDDAQQIIPPSMVEEFVRRDIELIIQADALSSCPVLIGVSVPRLSIGSRVGLANEYSF
jgi:hypothetical protein